MLCLWTAFLKVFWQQCWTAVCLTLIPWPIILKVFYPQLLQLRTKKIPTNRKKKKQKNPHFLQWYWVLTCKSSLRNIWWQMFKKAQTHMTVPHFDYTLITPVVCDLCILRHARLEGIIILNHVNGVQVNSSTSFCKINFGVIILWFIVAWN